MTSTLNRRPEGGSSSPLVRFIFVGTLAGLCLLTWFVLWLPKYSSRSVPWPDPVSEAQGEPTSVPLRLGQTLDEIAPTGQRELVAAPAPDSNSIIASSRLVTGLVRSQGSGRPLAAEVQIGELRTLSSEFDGFFSLVVPRDRIEPIHVRCAGYSEYEREVDDQEPVLDVGEIELQPSRETSVEVFDGDGRPIDGALVETSSETETPPSAGPLWHSLGRTGADGRLVTSLEPDTALLASSAAQTSDCVVFRGEQNRVTLCLLRGAAGTVGLRERQSAAPLSGMKLGIARISALPRLNFVVTTRNDGTIDRLLSPGQYVISDPSRRLTFPEIAGRVSTLAANDEVQIGRSHKTAVIQVSQGGGLVWLDMDRQLERSIVLEDSVTGTRLKPAIAWLESPGEDGTWKPVPGDTVVANDGRLSLYSFALIFMIDASYRLHVETPGYHPVIVKDPIATVPPGTLHVVAVQRGSARTLRVLRSDGRPFMRWISVWKQEMAAPIYTGCPRQQGLVGPFFWEKGDVILRNESFEQSRILCTVPAAEMQAQDIVDVILPTTGRIELVIPDGAKPEVFCTDARTRFWTGSWTGSKLVFEGLLPGGYEVGPKELLQSISFRQGRGESTHQVFVHEKETVVLDWNPSWSAPGEINGRVRAAGPPLEDLVVVPCFGSLNGPLSTAETSLRFPVDADGSFVLRGLTTSPTEVTFAWRRPNGELILLGTGKAEGLSEICCSQVIVTVEPEHKNEPAFPVSLLVVPRIGQRSSVGQLIEKGLSGEPISLGWLPCETHQLEVFAGTKAIKSPLVLHPGQVLRLKVKF